MSFEDVANRMSHRHAEGMIPYTSSAVDSDSFVQSLQESERRSRKTADLAFGSILFAVGLLITMFTYDAASQSGGTYVIAYGPMLVGAIRIIRGLAT